MLYKAHEIHVSVIVLFKNEKQQYIRQILQILKFYDKSKLLLKMKLVHNFKDKSLF